MPDNYPTATDLQTYLLATGLIDNPIAGPLASLDLAAPVAAAVQEWERRTGYRPFLAGPADTTRTFDPIAVTAPKGARRRGAWTLDLGAGLVWLSSLTTTGIALSSGVDYRVRPSNAASLGLPYTSVELVGPVSGLPDSIAVTGRWGYGLTVPDDAWQAIIAGAAWLCYPALSLSVSRGLERASVLDVQVDFSHRSGTGPLAAEAVVWKSRFDNTISRYRLFAW